MKPLQDMERKILARIQGDLPITARPFEGWARELGITPGELVDGIRELKVSGIVREVKAVLRHRSAGFPAGAMVAWAVARGEVEEVGVRLAGRREVSHCYERPGFGVYRLFSMIHGKSKPEVQAVVADIAASLGITDYRVYWSVAELKKSSMEYFREELT